MELSIDYIREALARTAYPDVDDPNLVNAGVMVLVYPKGGETCVLLNKRSQLVEHHKGEISFPGGARDSGDATILDTARRETQEEMGVSTEDVEVLGRLEQITTRSGFTITPFVGTIPHPYRFKVSGYEVAEVLEVPLSTLLEPSNQREEIRVQDDGEMTRQYAYTYGEHLVWGATARMLTQLLGLLASPGPTAGMR